MTTSQFEGISVTPSEIQTQIKLVSSNVERQIKLINMEATMQIEALKNRWHLFIYGNSKGNGRFPDANSDAEAHS